MTKKEQIRAYIEGRSLLDIYPVDIHREVCDIYGNGQMSRRSGCRWVNKFTTKTLLAKVALQQLQPLITS